MTDSQSSTQKLDVITSEGFAAAYNELHVTFIDRIANWSNKNPEGLPDN
jgi:hypothetical protein